MIIEKEYSIHWQNILIYYRVSSVYISILFCYDRPRHLMFATNYIADEDKTCS